MRARRRVVAVIVALGLAAAVAACTDDDGDATPPPRPPDEPATSAVDYSGVALGRVAGETTTTSGQTAGTAVLRGSVTGPGGLVPGATVRVERVVAGEDIRTDVLTGPDGRFVLGGVPGGRYRVRAFLPPALAMPSAEVRFLRDGQEHDFDLVVEDERRVVARGAVAPDPPYVDDDVNLAVVVATRSVDFDGVVRNVPVAGVRVELSGLGAWTLRTSPAPSTSQQPRSTTTAPPRTASAVAFTDGLGQATFELRCQVAGDPGLSLLVSVLVTPPAAEGQPPPPPQQQFERIPLELPSCIDPSSSPAPTAAEAPAE